MDNSLKNKSSIAIFVIILLLIAGGGYYLINYVSFDKKQDSKEYTNDATIKCAKLLENQDYVYYTDEDVLSKSLDLIYYHININLDTDDAQNLSTKLNQNMDAIKSDVTKISTSNVDKASLIYNQDDIYQAKMINYDYWTTSKYLNIVVSNYTFDATTEDANKDFNYYVFSLTSGKLLTNHDLLVNEDLTEQDVITKIRSYFADDTTIDIDKIMNDPYYLSIAKNGNIVINLIVTSTDFNYNISIEMD
jgi:flagellar basal body-associated protein FliL